MSNAPVPLSLKSLKPYLQHAKQTQKVDPIMAYYCKYYAATLGIGANPSDSADKNFLFSLLDELEVEKQSIKDKLLQPEYQENYVLQFCIKIFNKADTEDRNGNATRATARTFYAASIFFNTLKQFGDLSDDVQEMLKYAKWKAADINTAIKEGRKPTPGPAQTEDDIMKQIEAEIGSVDTNSVMDVDNSNSNQFSQNSIPSNNNNISNNNWSTTTQQDNQIPNSYNDHFYSSPNENNYSSMERNVQGNTYINEPTPEYKEPTSQQTLQTFGAKFFQHEQTPNTNTNFNSISLDLPNPPVIENNTKQNESFNTIPPSNNQQVNNQQFNNQQIHNQQFQYQNNNNMEMGNNSLPSLHQNNNVTPVMNQNQFASVSNPQIPNNSYQPPPEQYRYSPPTNNIQNTNSQHVVQQNFAPVQYSSTPIVVTTEPNMSEAYKFARFSVSALQFEDVPTAILNLKKSIGQLGINARYT